MKKLWKGLLVVALAVVVAGCGGNSDNANFGDSLIEKNTITVGISPDYPPYESINTKKEMVGFDIDMMNELMKYVNVDGEEYQLKWVKMDFDSIVTSLKGGQIDLGVSGFTYDESRKVEWSEPYYTSQQVVVVNKDSQLKTVDDLKGKKVAAQLGTTGEAEAKKIEGADVTAIKDAQVLFQNLMAHQYDAVVIDVAVAKNYIAKNNSLEMFDKALLEEENFIIAKEGNKAVIEKITEAVKKFKESDEFDKIEAKWMS